MLWNIVIWPMAIPDEKYQNSPTGEQAFPTGGLKPPCAPPVALRLAVTWVVKECWSHYWSSIAQCGVLWRGLSKCVGVITETVLHSVGCCDVGCQSVSESLLKQYPTVWGAVTWVGKVCRSHYWNRLEFHTPQWRWFKNRTSSAHEYNTGTYIHFRIFSYRGNTDSRHRNKPADTKPGSISVDGVVLGTVNCNWGTRIAPPTRRPRVHHSQTSQFMVWPHGCQEICEI